MSTIALLCLIALAAVGLVAGVGLWGWWRGMDDPDNYPGGQP